MCFKQKSVVWSWALFIPWSGHEALPPAPEDCILQQEHVNWRAPSEINCLCATRGEGSLSGPRTCWGRNVLRTRTHEPWRVLMRWLWSLQPGVFTLTHVDSTLDPDKAQPRTVSIWRPIYVTWGHSGKWKCLIHGSKKYKELQDGTQAQGPVMYLKVYFEHSCVLWASQAAQRERIYLPIRRPGFHPWAGKIPLENRMAIHSSIPAWEIPWTEEPCGLQSMELERVRHDWATEQALLSCPHCFLKISIA